MSFTSHPDYTEIIKNSGYLFWNPTDLSKGEAGWGTKLGFVEKGVAWEPGHGFIELDQPETGDEPVIGIYTGNNVKLAANLRNYNALALGRLFPGLSGTTFVKIPNTIKTGTNYYANSSYYGQLLYVPSDQINHPCLLLQKAVPRIQSTAKVRVSHVDKMIFPCIFTGARKTSGADGIMYVGPISGAVLR